MLALIQYGSDRPRFTRAEASSFGQHATLRLVVYDHNMWTEPVFLGAAECEFGPAPPRRPQCYIITRSCIIPIRATNTM